jgi:uncharacterized protein YkwD
MKKCSYLAISLVTMVLLTLLPNAYAANSNDAAMASEILMYVNQYRAQHGLDQLVMNDTISHEAHRHSQEMATHAVPFGHDGFSQRMHYLRSHVIDASSGAENVAYNYKTAKIVVDGWLHSPGHRRNIMGHYNLTGIGIVRDKAGKIYYTQMFLYQNT